MEVAKQFISDLPQKNAYQGVRGRKKNQLFPLVKNVGAKYDVLPIMKNREICLHNGRVT